MNVVSKRLHSVYEQITENETLFDTFMMDDAEIGIVAYGTTARIVRNAILKARKELGIRAGLIRPITLWPFADKELERLARRGKTIIVPELNCGQMVLEVERAVHGKARVVPLNRVDGELFQPTEIFNKIVVEAK